MTKSPINDLATLLLALPFKDMMEFSKAVSAYGYCSQQQIAEKIVAWAEERDALFLQAPMSVPLAAEIDNESIAA